MALATKVYENIQKEQEASNTSQETQETENKKDNDVKDAEFEEK